MECLPSSAKSQRRRLAHIKVRWVDSEAEEPRRPTRPVRFSQKDFPNLQELILGFAAFNPHQIIQNLSVLSVGFAISEVHRTLAVMMSSGQLQIKAAWRGGGRPH